MDISLHSFILVIGVIVIGFIIWDGVKKVRAARANQLDQTLEGYDDFDALADDEPLGFDDLEIKEELLQQALSDTDASTQVVLDQPEKQTKKNESSHSVFEVLDESGDDHKQVDANVASAHADPAIPLANMADKVNLEEDEFEHFSACDDVVEVAKSTHAVDSQQKSVVSSDNKQATLASVVLAEKSQKTVAQEPNRSTPLPVVEAKPKQAQRISKEALVAQLDRAKKEAEASIKSMKPEISAELEVDEKEPVPVLMEPVELGQKIDPNPPKQHELVLPERIQQTLQDEPVFEKTEKLEIVAEKHDPLMEYIEDVQSLPVGEKLSEREAAQEIFVINIFKQDGSGLLGKDLNHVFQVCDMRHGEMDIFHRFEKANAQGKIQFSVANAIQPGTFDLSTIDDQVTPGISLFMSLPGPEKPMEAFDAMAEVALVFARNFNASLHDDTHSDLTPQTLEHYRQRIREFTRKHLSQKK